MASITYKLTEKNIAHPPRWMPSNIHYETMMGSIAYGVNQDNSDLDVYGFCIPPRGDVFPHLRGEIMGFGRQKKRFEQYQQHHLIDVSARGGRGQEYDLNVYSIVKYFQLMMENNPNMIDSLYTPGDCVLHITQIGRMVRDSRDLFLHKGSWHKFRGYAYSQLSKMSGKSKESKRYELIERYGYDVKFAYHTVRLVLEAEQILAEGTIDLHRNTDILKAIRNGEWTEEKVRSWFSEKEMALETLYNSSPLQYKPDEEKIKELLLNCLEQHYGSLSGVVSKPKDIDMLAQDIEDVLVKYK